VKLNVKAYFQVPPRLGGLLHPKTYQCPLRRAKMPAWRSLEGGVWPDLSGLNQSAFSL